MKDFIRRSIWMNAPIYPSKRCPFCGAAGEGKSEKDASGKRMYYVECTKCKARSNRYLLLSAAVEHWDNQIYDTKQKHGEWLSKKDDQGLYIECSVCHAEYGYLEDEEPPYSPYCCSCGARLVQTEQYGERKISLEDQMDAAEFIKVEKNEKNRNLKNEKYHRQEMAEQFLREMIGIEDDEEDEADGNGQLVH